MKVLSIRNAMVALVIGIIASSCSEYGPMEVDNSEGFVAGSPIALLQECESEVHEPASLGSMLERIESWHRFDSESFAEHDYGMNLIGYDGSLREVDLGSVSLEGGEEINSLILTEHFSDKIELVREFQVEFHVGSVRNDEVEGNLVVLVFAEFDDEVVSVGDCAGYGTALMDYASSIGVSDQEILSSIVAFEVSGEDVLRWEGNKYSSLDPRDEDVWDSLPATERFLDHEFAPDSIMEETETIALYVDVNEQQFSTGRALCTRSELARGGACYNLDTAGTGLFFIELFPHVELELTLGEFGADGFMTELLEVGTIEVGQISAVLESHLTFDPLVFHVEGLGEASDVYDSGSGEIRDDLAAVSLFSLESAEKLLYGSG